jgi:hypothetical protein
MFCPRLCRGKLRRGTNASQLLLACALLIGSACLPDPQRQQMAHLLDELSEARAALSEQPPRLDPSCDMVGEVSSRLSGEPGLVDVRPAWSALRASTDALLATCGQLVVLQQPFEPTAAMLQARQRWQQGVMDDLALACTQMHRAAGALGKPAPC